MKKRRILPRSIRGKLIFYFGLTVALVVLLILLVFSQSMYRDLIKNNDLLIKADTREIANRIDKQNLEAVTIAKTMALAQKSGLFGKREISMVYARNILLENPKFTGSYFGYEPDADQNDKAYLEKFGKGNQGLNENGRFLPYWFVDESDKGKVKVNPLIDMEQSLYYQGCKENFLSDNKDKHMITEPYYYEGKMIVEQTFPIEINGKFMGIAGVDRALTDIHTYLEGFKPYKSAAFVLLSRKGKIISSTMSLASEETVSQLIRASSGEDKKSKTKVDNRMMTRNIAETDYKNLLNFFYDHSGPTAWSTRPTPWTARTIFFRELRLKQGTGRLSCVSLKPN